MVANILGGGGGGEGGGRANIRRSTYPTHHYALRIVQCLAQLDSSIKR